MNEFVSGNLTVNDFLNDLKLVNGLNDGGISMMLKISYMVVDHFMLQNVMVLMVLRIFMLREVKRLCLINIVLKQRTGATIVVTDNNVRENIYGEAYRIDKKVNEQWKELEPIIDNYAFNAIGYMVDDNNKLQLDIEWKWYMESLKMGNIELLKIRLKQEMELIII